MISLNLPVVLNIAALALSAMLFIKVAIKKVSDRMARSLLLLFLAALAGMSLNSVYFFSGLYTVWPNGSFVLIFLLPWLAPSLYFYARQCAGRNAVQCNTGFLLHWLPGPLLQLSLLPYFFISGEDKLAFLNSMTGQRVFTVIYVGIYLQMLIYIWKLLPFLRTDAESNNSDKRDADFSRTWLSWVSYGLVGFVIMDGILPHTGLPYRSMLYIMSTGLYLMTIIIVFLAMDSSLVYPVERNSAGKGGNKYLNSGLREDSAQYYRDRLDTVMQTELLYLDGELSMPALAAKLGVSPHHLSQVLNTCYRKTFYEYINELRVAHASQLLLDQPGLPVFDVALASGYNNKNSFYNAFRRLHNQSPGDYRKART